VQGASREREAEAEGEVGGVPLTVSFVISVSFLQVLL